VVTACVGCISKSVNVNSQSNVGSIIIMLDATEAEAYTESKRVVLSPLPHVGKGNVFLLAFVLPLSE